MKREDEEAADDEKEEREACWKAQSASILNNYHGCQVVQSRAYVYIQVQSLV